MAQDISFKEYWYFSDYKKGTASWVTILLCVCECGVRYLPFDEHSLFIFTAADPNAWRLGRIEEGDHETPVWKENFILCLWRMHETCAPMSGFRYESVCACQNEGNQCKNWHEIHV